MIQITNREFEKLAEYIKDNYGIHLKNEKQMLVMGRLQGLLIQNGFRSFSEYYDNLLHDDSGLAATAMINKITTNHTFFMREPEHFEFFRNEALPYFYTNVRDRDLRIWSAGCSSGEEPYTLAMILDDFLGNEKNSWDSKILATDISSNVLETARNGIYTNERISTLPEHFRKQYLRKHDEKTSIMTEMIRNEIIFRKFNLMETHFPFRKKFHMIFCRNVMIYFDEKTKMELISKFYDYLEPGGYLFIGHSESINRGKSKFAYVKPALYRK